MDLMERIAYLLEKEQKDRFRVAKDKKSFFKNHSECEIFNAIQDCRAQSTTYKKGS